MYIYFYILCTSCTRTYARPEISLFPLHPVTVFISNPFPFPDCYLKMFYPCTLRSVKLFVFIFLIFIATFRIVGTGTERLVVAGHASVRIRPTTRTGCGAKGLRHSSAALESSRRRRVVQFRVTLVSGGAPHTRAPEFIYFTLLLLLFFLFSPAVHALAYLYCTRKNAVYDDVSAITPIPRFCRPCTTSFSARSTHGTGPYFQVTIFRTIRESGSLGDGRFVGGISRLLRELWRPAAGAQQRRPSDVSEPQTPSPSSSP